jgi:hypothetical protein
MPVLDVELSGDGATLFAATFGRSVWKVALLWDWISIDEGGLRPASSERVRVGV